MAGFFGFFDYTRPGPGVPKDAPPKPRIVVFFEIYSRKFWKLVSLNLMFFIFNIPALIAMLYVSQFFIQKMMSSDPIQDLILRLVLGSVFLCIPVITVGPVQAGFTYILRNYSREEHAFLWWDFKDAAKRNFKESVIISLIDLVATILVGLDLNAYFALNQNNSLLLTVASGFIIVAFIVFIMMHMYIYPMLVTFKLSIKQLYKNAFLFAMMRFLPNLGILLLCTALIVASFWNTIIGIVLLPLITMSTIGLIINYYVYPALKKHIMDKIPDAAPAGNNEEHG